MIDCDEKMSAPLVWSIGSAKATTTTGETFMEIQT
jgi:hypothetical protein